MVLPEYGVGVRPPGRCVIVYGRRVTTQVSSFGVIPKRHQPDKRRLILDLSSPRGRSVNNGIARDLSSFSYISVADIALLAKSDIKHDYRQVPVHPDDRLLLGVRWNGQLFCDATLPFGLRSALIIFSAVADALQWIVKSRGVSTCSTTWTTS